MARPSNTAERQRQITDALLKVMAEQGYAKATIQAIAKAAGMRPGLIHYHFKTKQDILISLVRQVHDIGMCRYRLRVAKADSPASRLRAFVEARLARGEDAAPDALAAWVVIGTEAMRQPEVRQEYEKSIAIQMQVLREILIEVKPHLSAAERERLVAITLAAMEGAFQLSVAASDIMPTGYAARGLLEMIESRLGIHPAPEGD